MKSAGCKLSKCVQRYTHFSLLTTTVCVVIILRTRLSLYSTSVSLSPTQVLDGREPLATIKEAKSVLFTHESGESSGLIRGSYPVPTAVVAVAPFSLFSLFFNVCSNHMTEAEQSSARQRKEHIHMHTEATWEGDAILFTLIFPTSPQRPESVMVLFQLVTWSAFWSQETRTDNEVMIRGSNHTVRHTVLRLRNQKNRKEKRSEGDEDENER